MCVAGQQGGPQPIRLSSFRRELAIQEGRDPTDTFSQDIRGTDSGQRTTGPSGFGPVREQASSAGVGLQFAALRSRREENTRIERGLRGGTLGQSGGASLLTSSDSAPTSVGQPREDVSLAGARRRRGRSFLS